MAEPNILSDFKYDSNGNPTYVNRSTGIPSLIIYNNATETPASIISGTTASTSTTTGSLKNAGGFGNVGELYNGGNGFFNGNLRTYKRFIGAQGANVNAATTITLGDGNFFIISGTGNIEGIVYTGWDYGSEITLQVLSGITLVHNSGFPGTNAAKMFFYSGSNLAGPTTVKFVLSNNGGTVWMNIT